MVALSSESLMDTWKTMPGNIYVLKPALLLQHWSHLQLAVTVKVAAVAS